MQVKMKSVLGYCALIFTLLLSCSVQAAKKQKTVSSQGTDCTQIKTQSPDALSGVYVIQPAGANNHFKVYCEMTSDGGWTVFQRRSGGSVSFNRKWVAYKNGFGNLTEDYWLGLKKVFALTKKKSKKWILRVDLWDHEGGSAFAEYKNFRLGNEKTAFKLHVGKYSGNAGDAIRGAYRGIDQNGFGFSTIDRDNDGCSPCIFGDIAEAKCAFLKVRMKALLNCFGFILGLLLSCSVQAGKTAFPEDCADIRNQTPQAPSGVYEIQPAGGNGRFKVYCEMRPDVGWIVFQRRTGGVVSFDRKWAFYKYGFGSLAYDHWLGLEKVHLLTKDKTKKWTLRVDLWDHEGSTAFAEYNNFKIGNEGTAYKLQVGRYSGNAGDAIRGAYPGIDQNGFGFSTIDRDNDGCSPCIFGDIAEAECALSEGGGWWYSRCGSASLNGEWHPSGDHIGWASGLHWLTWKPPAPYSAQATRMMIKPE